MHRILLDTNVLLDFLLERNHYYPESKKILDACDRGMFVGYMAAHSVPHMFLYHGP